MITVRSYTRIPDPPAFFREGQAFELEVRAGTTVADLVTDIMAIPKGYVAITAVNGELRDEHYTLKDCDHVELFPPVGGG
jgi:molybdopterin converting factor small subunit